MSRPGRSPPTSSVTSTRNPPSHAPTRPLTNSTNCARRRGGAPAPAAAMAASLILGTTASAWQAVRATTAEAQANASATRAEEKAQEATTQRDEAQRQRDEVRVLNDRLQRSSDTA